MLVQVSRHEGCTAQNQAYGRVDVRASVTEFLRVGACDEPPIAPRQPLLSVPVGKAGSDNLGIYWLTAVRSYSRMKCGVSAVPVLQRRTALRTTEP